MLEVRQDDAMLGSFDPVTGKPIPSIPLLYTDDLRAIIFYMELLLVKKFCHF